MPIDSQAYMHFSVEQYTKNSPIDKKYDLESRPQVTVRSDVSSDLYKTLLPAYHLSKAWGLLPVRFVKSSSDRYSGRLRFPDIVYSVCLLLALISAQMWGLWRDLRDGWENSTRMRSRTTVVVTFTDIMAVVILASVSVLGSPYRWNKIQNIMDILVETDEKLGVVASRENRRFSIFLVSSIMMYLSVISTVDFCAWHQNAIFTKKRVDKGPVNYVPLYLLYFIVLTIEIQYALAAYSLNQRFVRLNKSLQSILHRCRNANSTQNDFRYEEFREYGQFRSLIRSETEGGELFRRKKTPESERVRNVDHSAAMVAQLVAVHSTLLDCVLLINSAFGTPVLLMIATCLLHLIVTPYFLVIGANEQINGLFIASQFLWSVAHVIRLLIIVEPSYSATTEAKGTVILVSRLLLAKWKPDVRIQLEIFSQQLQHRPLEFTACGLCTLDRSLVTSIAGAVTTYLVILIQFQKADDATNILKHAA